MIWQLALVFALTFLVESLTEYIFGQIFDKIPKAQPYKFLLMYLAMLFGVGLCFYYSIDLISLIPPGSNVTPVGIVLTGLVVGRGSNFLHQFVSQFFPQKEP